MPSREGRRLELLSADMSTLAGKLDALVAVVNIMRLLCAMSKHLPLITWGVGQAFIVKDGNKIISRVTNMGGECSSWLPKYSRTLPSEVHRQVVSMYVHCGLRFTKK
jgi:hypothetical protein